MRVSTTPLGWRLITVQVYQLELVCMNIHDDIWRTVVTK
jgi:hypothetical protein